MKLFVRNIILFSLLLAAALGVGEMLARRVTTVFGYRVEWMAEHADSVEMIITGNSHTYMGIDPEMMPEWRAFNVAHMGQQVSHDYFFLKHNIDRFPRLRYYVMAMSPWTPFTSVEQPDFEWYEPAHYSYCPPTNPTLRQRWLEPLELTHTQTYRFKLIPFIDSPAKHFNSLGQNTLYTLAYRLPDWKRSAIKANMVKQFSPEETARGVAYIDSIATLCNERDIRLVMINAPHHSLYVELLNPEVMELYYRIVSDIRSRHDVLYLDYLTSPVFTDIDYDDASHVNCDIGAPKLTRMVVADIIADSIARSSSTKATRQ